MTDDLLKSVREVKGCGAETIPYDGFGDERHGLATEHMECDACLHLVQEFYTEGDEAERPTHITVVCVSCGGKAGGCGRCAGVGRRSLGDSLLAELRGRVVCVSGSEVEGLLDMIADLRSKLSILETSKDKLIRVSDWMAGMLRSVEKGGHSGADLRRVLIAYDELCRAREKRNQVKGQ